MGPQERAANDACAAALEPAFASASCAQEPRLADEGADLVDRWPTGGAV